MSKTISGLEFSKLYAENSYYIVGNGGRYIDKPSYFVAVRSTNDFHPYGGACPTPFDFDYVVIIPGIVSSSQGSKAFAYRVAYPILNQYRS